MKCDRSASSVAADGAQVIHACRSFIADPCDKDRDAAQIGRGLIGKRRQCRSPILPRAAVLAPIKLERCQEPP